MPQLGVIGAHLSGQPLNHQLTDRGAHLVATTRTAPWYRLVALETAPPKPGMYRVRPDDPNSAGIEIEIWSLTDAGFGSFVAMVPSPLCIGTVDLADASTVAGFLCEHVAARDAQDITSSGGWRSFLAGGQA